MLCLRIWTGIEIESMKKLQGYRHDLRKKFRDNFGKKKKVWFARGLRVCPTLLYLPLYLYFHLLLELREEPTMGSNPNTQKNLGA